MPSENSTGVVARKAAGTRAVFLDRDGVLTRAIVRGGRPYAPRGLDEFEILPDAAEPLRLLKRAGFLLVVVTNQPDVARGVLPRAVMEEMHARLAAALPLDDIRACVEEESPGSTCYKPRPGMLLDAARAFRIDLAASWMVGDRWRDVGAGRAAGCRTVFIDRGYTERAPESPDAVVASLAEAATLVLGYEQKRNKKVHN